MDQPEGGLQWSNTHNSHFKPDKLQLVDFTRKRTPTGQTGQCTTPITRPPLTLGTREIAPSSSYKYLGVILDQELRFREHAAYALARGTKWTLQFCRLSKPKVGMLPRYARQLYKAVAVPKMLYAADIFLTPMQTQQGDRRLKGSVGIIKRLARVQRMAALHITGAMRTTANDVLDAHADLLPFQFLVNQICYRATLRLSMLLDTHPLFKHVRKAKRYVKWHQALLHELLHAFRINPEEIETVSASRYVPGKERRVEVRIAADKDGAYREGTESRAGTKIFTDGSDIDGGVGAAAILFKDGQRRGTLRAYLGATASHTVYEAELVGILLATHLIKTEGCSQETEICTDSQAAISALNLDRPAPSHYLVDKACRALKKVRLEHPAVELLVRWIPGHMGIEGNELADLDAKKAAAQDASPPHALPTSLRTPLPTSSSASKREHIETIKREAAAYLAQSKRYPRLHALDATAPSARFRKLTAKLSRRQASLLVQLRTGHIPLNHHLARIGATETPTCPACHEREETVHHYLMVCPAYATQRRALRDVLSRDAHSISQLLAHPKAMKPLFRYISATGGLRPTFGDLSTDRQRGQEPTP